MDFIVYEGCICFSLSMQVKFLICILCLESDKYKMKYDDKSGNVSLLINHIGPGDEGEYTCTARNQYGEAICSVFIQPEGTRFKICIMFRCARSEIAGDPMFLFQTGMRLT